MLPRKTNRIWQGSERGSDQIGASLVPTSLVVVVMNDGFLTIAVLIFLFDYSLALRFMLLDDLGVIAVAVPIMRLTNGHPGTYWTDPNTYVISQRWSCHC